MLFFQILELFQLEKGGLESHDLVISRSESTCEGYQTFEETHREINTGAGQEANTAETLTVAERLVYVFQIK